MIVRESSTQVESGHCHLRRQRYSKEQIQRKLNRAIAALTRGATIPEVCRMIGISEATFHRWRKRSHVVEEQPSGHAYERKAPSAPGDRIRELDRENRRLKLLVGDLMLEIAFLKDALWSQAGG